MAFYRWLSPIERSSYLVFDTKEHSPRVNQFVIEGEGELNLADLKKAVTAAAKVHPGARLILKGHSRLSYWDDKGPLPEVIEVDASDWDGFTAENASFLYNPMSLRDGPTLHVVLLHGPKPRLMLRSHHAVMDGTGSFMFLQDVFRSLRGEELVGSNSTLCDFDIFKQNNFGTGKIVPPGNKALPVFGAPQGLDTTPVWRRISIPGNPSRTLQKVALAIAAEARNQAAPGLDSNQVRLRIPVDLRRHLSKETVTTANCVSAIDLEIGSQDTDKTLFRQMVKKLKDKQELNMSKQLGLLRWIPSSAFKQQPEILKKQYGLGLFPRTGTISHLGKFPSESFSCPGFKAILGLGAAPQFDFQSIYVGMWDREDRVDVLGVAPHAFGGNGRLDAFMERLPGYFNHTSELKQAS